MNANNAPPSYEESNEQYKGQVSYAKKSCYMSTRGPDILCHGLESVIADFVPFGDNYPCEDIGYLLLRANNWLQDNPLYDVKKCEMIPRMINSKQKLEISNCYNFNMSYGRRYFVNQLRLHIKINKLKEKADRICLETIIPDIIQERTSLQEDYIFSRLRIVNQIPKFDDMFGLLEKLNKNIQNSTITGTIINISSFYLNIIQYILRSNTQLQDDVIFFEEFNQGKCHLKCFRIFYKPGKSITTKIGIESFKASNGTDTTLNDITYCALNWMEHNCDKQGISLETFSEYSVKNNLNCCNTLDDCKSTFIFFDKNSTLIKKEIVNVFYFFDMEVPLKRLTSIDTNVDIIWITPRKYKHIYETYYSFLNYLRYVIVTYDEYILDIESLMIQNPLSWSSIRHQTVERYYSENATNHQIFTIKLITSKGKMSLPLKGAPLPCISSTKYSEVCTIL